MRRRRGDVIGCGWVVVGYKHPVLRTPLYFDFAQYKLWRGISRVGGLWMGMFLCYFFCKPTPSPSEEGNVCCGWLWCGCGWWWLVTTTPSCGHPSTSTSLSINSGGELRMWMGCGWLWWGCGWVCFFVTFFASPKKVTKKRRQENKRSAVFLMLCCQRWL